MTRPAPYNPALRCVPWWWRWGGIWQPEKWVRCEPLGVFVIGETEAMTRYATWPQARAYRRRAKKGKKKI